jgi:hypothetical protein
MLTEGLKETNLGRKKNLGLMKKPIWEKLILGAILVRLFAIF